MSPMLEHTVLGTGKPATELLTEAVSSWQESSPDPMGLGLGRGLGLAHVDLLRESMIGRGLVWFGLGWVGLGWRLYHGVARDR